MFCLKIGCISHTLWGRSTKAIATIHLTRGQINTIFFLLNVLAFLLFNSEQTLNYICIANWHNFPYFTIKYVVLISKDRVITILMCFQLILLYTLKNIVNFLNNGKLYDLRCCYCKFLDFREILFFLTLLRIRRSQLWYYGHVIRMVQERNARRRYGEIRI